MRSLILLWILANLDLSSCFRHGNNPPLFGDVTTKSSTPPFFLHRKLLLHGETYQRPADGIKATPRGTIATRRRYLLCRGTRTNGKLGAPTFLRGGAILLTTAAPPALSAWLPPALFCALAYALYNLFLKQASSSIDPVLGGVLLQIVAAALGAVLLGVQQLSNGSSTLQWNRLGVAWAVAAGAAVGTAEILSFIISGMGVPASKSIPTIIGGSVVMGTILGTLWLGERLTPRGWLGIVLIALGIGLVGVDPGASLH